MRQLTNELEQLFRIFLSFALFTYVGAGDIYAQASVTAAPRQTRLAPYSHFPKSPIFLTSASLRRPASTSAQASPKPEEMMMPMPLIAPLFIEDGRVSSVITMVNEVDKKLDAGLEVYGPDGTLAASETVAFGAHTQQTVALSDVLRRAHSGVTSGWVKLSPDPQYASAMPVAAQLSFAANLSGSSAYAEEEFMMQNTFNGSNTWRLASPASSQKPLLALVNVSDKAVTAVVACTEERQVQVKRQFEVSPHQRALVTACSSGAQEPEAAIDRLLERNPAGSRVYGIEVTNSGSSGDLLSYGLATSGERVTRQLLALNFANTGTAKSADTVFVGVPLGYAELFPGSDFKPALSLANFGDATAQISIRLASMDGSDPVARVIANLALPPKSVRCLALPSSGALSPGFRNSFVVSSDKAPGTVYSSMLSASDSTQTTVQLLGKRSPAGPERRRTPLEHSRRPQVDVVVVQSYRQSPRLYREHRRRRIEMAAALYSRPAGNPRDQRQSYRSIVRKRFERKDPSQRRQLRRH